MLPKAPAGPRYQAESTGPPGTAAPRGSHHHCAERSAARCRIEHADVPIARPRLGGPPRERNATSLGTPPSLATRKRRFLCWRAGLPKRKESERSTNERETVESDHCAEAVVCIERE